MSYRGPRRFSIQRDTQGEVTAAPDDDGEWVLARQVPKLCPECFCAMRYQTDTPKCVVCYELEKRERELTALREWKAKATEVLTRIEWVDGDCPSCGQWKDGGHKPDCELAALLKS